MDYVMKKRRNIYCLIHKITEYKENSHFVKLTHDPTFDPNDIIIHLSMFLRTFGFETEKKDNQGEKLILNQT